MLLIEVLYEKLKEADVCTLSPLINFSGKIANCNVLICCILYGIDGMARLLLYNYQK